MADPSPLYQLADMLVEGGIAQFVNTRRPGTSWRAIARELWQVTNHRIDVTDVTLRSWFIEDGSEPAGADATEGAA